MWLEGLKRRKERLGPMGLLGWVNDMNLVLVILRRGLWGHVVNVVDLRCAGVVVGLLDRVGPLGGRFGGLGVMGLVHLLLLVSALRCHLGLMMTFKTSATLMRVAIAVRL